jgi:hypothetical protein
MAPLNPMKHKRPAEFHPPAAFRIMRDIDPGRHPLLKVFPGLDRVAAFRKYPCSPLARKALASDSSVEIARRKGEWMYVAPHELPPDADKRWKPLVTEDDCVVISREHLQRSPAMVLYLDILHELFHVIQRQSGRELWDEKFSYVNRPTEVEAYQFAVEEARRLRVPDSFLDDYLRVMWVSKKDHRQLLKNVGVSAAVEPRVKHARG